MLRKIIRARNKPHGLGEREASRLIQPFVVPRTAYRTACFLFANDELRKINAVIKQAYKTDMGIPNLTCLIRLLELGGRRQRRALGSSENLPK